MLANAILGDNKTCTHKSDLSENKENLLVFCETNKNSITLINKVHFYQNEISDLYKNGDYKTINKNFDKYIDIIEKLLDIDNENGKIIILDLITKLFINLSFCVFNCDNQTQISILGNRIENELEGEGLLKHLILIQISNYKNTLKENKNSKLDTVKIEEKITKIEEENPKNSMFQFSSKDRYQYKNAKFENHVHNIGISQLGISDFQFEFGNEFTGKIDSEIHFAFLRALGLKKEVDGCGSIERDKACIEAILNGDIIDDNKREMNLSQVNSLLQQSIIVNATIKNKILLFDSILLLVEIEENQKKKEEYFFTAWGYVKKHFGNLDNYYKQNLIEIGEKLFPGLPTEYIERLYSDYMEIKKRAIYSHGIVHDINNPLNVILGISQLVGGDFEELINILKEENFNIHDISSQITNNYDLFLKMVSQVKNLAGMLVELRSSWENLNSEFEIKLNKSFVNIKEFIEKIVNSQNIIIESQKKDICIIINSVKDFEIHIDKTRFNRVIKNIISNSIKFIPEGTKGIIKISTSIEDEFVILNIEDNGIGIKEEDLGHIFEAQMQSGSLENKKMGSGLGLSISKEIVELHNGQIFAYSEGEELGAIFTIKIPLTSELN